MYYVYQGRFWERYHAVWRYHIMRYHARPPLDWAQIVRLQQPVILGRADITGPGTVRWYYNTCRITYSHYAYLAGITVTTDVTVTIQWSSQFVIPRCIWKFNVRAISHVALRQIMCYFYNKSTHM
jgi:hypothetical protein